ncbi:TIGR02391 family protein [Flavitalea sp. BT771]|uniref:TIGR02391 family protein n=1 Tax=Flavitalea sp. BT771 TaxID=3063329 RepID=UPI0026E1D9E5|nr:TIGR02391 family protein [Flavitalea sp. BT771]MDO6433509.1 TIGR02391 family protein [Flavitalea sp. BT771]MDV6222586.1 TIGR02391 family protein [Flavitalea sp. BT771]
MVRWKYIALQLAQTYSALPLGGRYTPEHLARSWASIFDEPVGNYYDPKMMSGGLAVMYNFFMTIANREDLSDSEKVGYILHLLKIITSGFNTEKVDKILKDGGYVEKVTYDYSDKELAQILNFHPEIINHCSSLFKRGHYSNAVNEACKAYNQAVKNMSGCEKDGRPLMLWVFSEKGNLRVNSYTTTTEKDEQDGIMFLSAGLMAGFRNPTSHETAKEWNISKEKCIEILALASLLFKVLDDTSVIKI